MEQARGGKMRNLSYEEYYWMRGDQFQNGDKVYVKLVLSLGYANDYAIYRGPSTWIDEMVAEQGDKLSVAEGEAVAKALFPTATYDKHYRR